MKTIIHVDQATIRKNRKTGSNDPPLIIRTWKGTTRAHEIEVVGKMKIINSPHKPLKCGARVWLETEDTVKILEETKNG